MTSTMIEVNGARFYIVPENEYLPSLPPTLPNGCREAVAFTLASIARDIITERHKLGLTQSQLAKLAGIRTETLCRLETGKCKPNIRTVERIEAAFKKARKK